MPLTNDIQSVLLYVDRHKHLPCWIWQGAEQNNGYGKVTINYKSVLVHRYVYEQLKGSIPSGLQIDHKCRNKLCCNPDHLEPVTIKVNMERRASYITECKYGHPLVNENLYITPDGRRQCRICNRLRQQKFKGG